jgi:GNAT superfamily N-acetyltransferase
VPSYRIRPATAEDVGFLADVVIEATRAQSRLPADFDEQQWRNGFAEWTMEQVRAEIPDSTTSVVEVDGQSAGRLRITRTAEYIELSGIQLLPDVQGQGIGTAIVEGLKAQAAAVGIPLDLGVERDNPEARRLYERLGFIQVGETEQECKLRWNPRPDSDPPKASTGADSRGARSAVMPLSVKRLGRFRMGSGELCCCLG